MIDVGQNKAPRGHTKLLQSALTPAAIARVAQSPNTYRLPVITWRKAGHSRTLSAHRFSLLLEHGDAAAQAVAEHRCNEPLCVRTGDHHVILSTQAANLAYAVACGRAIGNQPSVLADGRSRAQRSRDVRAAVAEGWDSAAYYRAAGLRPRPTEPVLF